MSMRDEKATEGDAELKMIEEEEDKDEDMRDEEKVSDSEEGGEEKEVAAGPPGINHSTPLQTGGSEKRSDSSHGCSHHNQYEKPDWHTLENLSPPQEMRQ